MKSELRQVRKELAELLFEQQQLLQVSGPNLEARYQKALGRYEVELQQVRLQARRLRRQLEITRAGWQTGQPAGAEEVEKQLDQELWEWRRRLTEQKDKQEAAEHRLRRMHSPEVSAVLRSLYRQLVKRLHPDLHPQHSPEQQKLWFEVQQAYQWADWRRLETLLAICEEDFEETPAELERLRSRRRELVDSLQELRSQFPHNLKAQLEDESWLEGQVAQLKLHILLERQKVTKLEAMLQEYRLA